MAIVDAKFRWRRNHRGVGKVLNGPAAIAILRAMGNRAAQAAGPGHTVTAGPGRNRARAVVRASTPEAWQSEKKHRTLTKALDHARRS